jgi:tetratricopeptide (TPR) repeat protein
LLLGYVCNTFLLIILLGFDYEFLHQNIFRVYPIIAYCVVSIWMVLGIKTLIKFIDKPPGVQLKTLPVMLSILIIGIMFFINIKINYRAEDVWAEKYAKTILDNLPNNAVIFTDGDLDLTIIGYLNKIQNYREDVAVYSHKGIVFSNRLFIPRKNTTSERAILIDDFLQSTTRPVYYTYGLPHTYGIVNYGLFKKVDMEFSADRQIAYANPDVVSYIKNIISYGEPDDPWEKMHYRLLLADYCNLSLMLMENTKQAYEKQELTEWVNIVCNTFHGYLRYAELLLSNQDSDIDKISKLLDKAQLLENQIVFKSEAGMFLYLKGMFNEKIGESSKAFDNYNESYRLWPHPDNPALTRLQNTAF